MKQFTVAISLLTTTRPRKGEEMKIYVSKSVSKHNLSLHFLEGGAGSFIEFMV